MKIWINSCHAALEYVHAQTFQRLGHTVSGLFDLGSKQRPKVEGVTDVRVPDEVHEANKVMAVTDEMMGNPDVVIVHQTSDFPERVARYASMGVHAVAVLFGQGSMDQHMRLAQYARASKKIWLAPYALKEFNMYAQMGVPAERMRLLRFGNARSDFDPNAWQGADEVCFVPCNSIHRRGDGCNWATLKLLMGSGLPLVISGHQTEEIGGLGELTFDEYRDRLKRSACYLHVGTVPAPYTMTLVEAACSGTPIVAMNNACGLTAEGFDLDMAMHADGAFKAITRILSESEHRRNRHEHSVYLAETMFSESSMLTGWENMFRNISDAIGRGE